MGSHSAGDVMAQTSKFEMLQSAEEYNVSPFDSKSLLYARALSNSNNKYICYVSMYACMHAFFLACLLVVAKICIVACIFV